MDDSTETESESTPDLAPPKRSSSGAGKQQPWKLHQKDPDENSTEGSDLENFDATDKESSSYHAFPSNWMETFGSNTSHGVPGNKSKNKKGHKARHIITKVQAESDSEKTDDEHMRLSVNDFREIVRQELGSRGKEPLTLKDYGSKISHKGSAKIQRKVPANLEVASDATDESDLDVGMLDYYKIRHQNEHVPKKISVVTEFNLSDEEAKVKEGESDESDLEVNMRDYYVIRHETTPKAVVGPYMIDHGLSLKQSSVSKKAPPEKLSKAKLPLLCDTSGRNTDNEDISCGKDDFMTPCEHRHAFRTNADMRKLDGSSKGHQGKASNGPKVIDSPKQEPSEEEEESSVSSNSESLPTESDAEDLDAPIEPSTRKKKVPPIIRLIEVEGVLGTVGVVCAPTSPTRDNVHGIKFLDNNSSQMEKTEEFSNTSELEGDMEQMETKGPATDNEDLSDLEHDDGKHVVPQYVLPETKKKVCHVKTSKDGRTVSTENLVKLDESVSLNQFVQEIENLSESDVCDWSEEEIKIVRRLSGDFGRLGNKKPQLAQPVEKPAAVSKNKTGKKSGRSRRSGGHKKGNKGSAGANLTVSGH